MKKKTNHTPKKSTPLADAESTKNPPFVFIGLDIGGPEGDIGVITTREL